MECHGVSFPGIRSVSYGRPFADGPQLSSALPPAGDHFLCGYERLV
jgi:hypothetical protein